MSMSPTKLPGPQGGVFKCKKDAVSRRKCLPERTTNFRKRAKSRNKMSSATQPRPLLKTLEIALEKLRQFAESGYLYAVLDSTDAPKIPPKMQELGEDRAVSLFKGTAQQDYWAVAPYLTKVDIPMLRWLFENVWKEPWGIFAVSKASLEELQSHFRKFLVVQLPDGKPWMFRFYDPRIIATFLGSCNEQELRSFFGSVRAFVAMYGERSKLLTI
jgi:hypothetical protein